MHILSKINTLKNRKSIKTMLEPQRLKSKSG